MVTFLPRLLNISQVYIGNTRPKIADKTHIETVIENLSLANFDPEFFDQYEGEFVKMYNQKSGKSLRLKSRRKLSKVEQFLFG